MKISLHGKVSRKVVACIGQWDPITYDHLNIFDFIKKSAFDHKLDSCVILLHPPPVNYLMEREYAIYYSSIESIIQRILSLGINGVLECEFESIDDTHSNATTFIPKIDNFIKLKYLFMGSSQTIGQGEDGNQRTIAALGKSYKFYLRTFPHCVFTHSYKRLRPRDKVKQLVEGRFRFNKDILPYNPTFYIKDKLIENTHFKDGMYKVGFKEFINGRTYKKSEISCQNGNLILSNIGQLESNIQWLTIEKGPSQ